MVLLQYRKKSSTFVTRQHLFNHAGLSVWIKKPEPQKRTWLVGGIPTPLKNMSSSVGMMIISNIWKNKIHVPNHQPDENRCYVHTLIPRKCSSFDSPCPKWSSVAIHPCNHHLMIKSWISRDISSLMDMYDTSMYYIYIALKYPDFRLLNSWYI